MTLEHDLLQLARDAMRSLMNGRDFGTGQTGHYLNIIQRIEDELNRPKPELDPEPAAWMYPSTLKDFEHGEKADYAYSIQMGNMKTGEETVPLYELDEVKHDL